MTEQLTGLTTVNYSSFNYQMTSENLQSKYQDSTESIFHKTGDFNNNWFVLLNEDKGKDLVKRYFKILNYNSVIEESLILLENKKSLDLMSCLNNCNASSKCKAIHFEKEKCRIFDAINFNP